MERKNKKTLIQGVVSIGTVGVMIVAFIIAFQTYFSYLEVTEASNGCFDLGGVPIIEKSGIKMTYFHCHME